MKKNILKDDYSILSPLAIALLAIFIMVLASVLLALSVGTDFILYR